MDSTDLRFDFAALPERVWDALANPVKAALWLPGGAVADVGQRITLPSGLVGEVISVDPPNRVEFRCRPAVGDMRMTWVVSPVPGGASVHVIISSAPASGLSDQLIGDLRTLFDQHLRGVLRGRRVPPPAPPAEAARAGDGESQAVRVWPAVRMIERLRTRTGGTSLAIRLVAVIALGAALGAITLGVPSIPWAAPPGESTLDDDDAVLGSPDSSVPAAAPTAGSAGSAGTAATNPGSVSSPAPFTAPVTATPLTQLPVLPLDVSLTVSDRVLNLKLLVGYTVTVSITNSAGVGQTWQNVAVHLGPALGVTALESFVNLDLVGTDACATPAGSATIAAAQTVTFSFTVAGVSLGEPTGAVLNQPGCG